MSAKTVKNVTIMYTMFLIIKKREILGFKKILILMMINQLRMMMLTCTINDDMLQICVMPTCY